MKEREEEGAGASHRTISGNLRSTSRNSTIAHCLDTDATAFQHDGLQCSIAFLMSSAGKMPIPGCISSSWASGCMLLIAGRG